MVLGAGRLYALLGAVSVSELASMLPQAGGFYVTHAVRSETQPDSRRMGDWFNQTASLAYVSMTASVFLGTLWPPAAQYAKSGAVLTIAA